MKDERKENDAFPRDTGLGILIKIQELYSFYAFMIKFCEMSLWYVLLCTDLQFCS